MTEPTPLFRTYASRGAWGIQHKGEWLAEDFGLLLTHRVQHARKWNTWSEADGWRSRNGLPADEWEIRRIEPDDDLPRAA